jgi:membrane-bound lytic murein transglycosylase D
MKLPRILLFLSFVSFCNLALASNDLFPEPPALEPAVHFWIRVYTEITTDAGYIHDQNNLAVVYEALHFSPSMSPSQRQHEVDAEKQRFHDLLLQLAKGSAPDDAEARRVRALWGAAGTPDRLLVAADDVRFQLGQADRFRAGLVRSGAWKHHIADVLARLGLPAELAALPDVESSFDPAAYSKVGAAGLWQFLRSTGRRFLRINASVDERFDPFRETEAAGQLLSYNYRLLGSWPLAITAYNHGAAGMMRARDQLGTDDIVRIIHDYHSPSFGFASRNFYVSFLAALTVSQDPTKYFGDLHTDGQIDFHELRMPRAASVASLTQTLGLDRRTLQRLNPALRPSVWSGRRLIPAGYLLRLPADDSQWNAQLLADRLRGARAVEVAAIAPAGAAASTAAGAAAGEQPTERHAPRAQPLAAASASKVPTADLLAALRAPPGALARSEAEQSTATLFPAVQAEATAPSSQSFTDFPGTAVGAAVDLTAQGDARASGYYWVQPGDTAGSIASRAGLPVAQLLALNSLPDQDFLYEGERLRVAPSVPEPGSEGNPALAALTQQALQENQQEQQAVALASRQAASSEPVSAAQAAAAGPQLAPGATASQWVDPVDYSVASDGSIRVVAAETLGHYAEWLDTSATRLRALNHLRGRRPVVMGERLQLPFDTVTPQQFEQRRREYHAQLQAAYFSMHKIVGTGVYVIRRGDSLWNITRHDLRIPIWLLQQYNPSLDFVALKPGTQVSLPRVEDAGM